MNVVDGSNLLQYSHSILTGNPSTVRQLMEAMLIIEPTPQSDALAAALSARRHVPEKALKAVSGVRELEQEVGRLHARLSAKPVSAAMEQAWKKDIAALLGKVILFRLALADSAGTVPAGTSSSNGETEQIKTTGVGHDYR
jgi:hypothetical protein